MASRIIHLAITKKILQNTIVRDANMLYLGTILPDAYNINRPSTNVSHYKEDVCNGTKKTYNLTKFRSRFKDKICTNDLYLGYYLHLIQDIIYRRFVYDNYKWNPKIPGNVQKLHNDYRLINTYVIDKYNLKINIDISETFQDEEINNIYPFDVKQLLNDLENDFVPYKDGEIFFFTENMADEYIEKAVELCLEEIRALRNKTTLLDEMQYAWSKS
jgi:protein-tyrosine phosphatase